MLPRKALRCRKPQAAGEIARPTKSPQVGGGTQTSADRQTRRRPGRILARPGAAPLRRLRRHLPLQGRLYGQLPLKKAPLQGELDAPQGAARGVHCRLAAEISCKAWQNPALCFVGDDLRAKSRHFVPAALRNAACGRQCSHRPAEPCGGFLSPLRRPCAPHCRAGVHARRGSLRRVEHFGFAQALPRKALRYHKPQAAGENARPTKSPQVGAAPASASPCQARRRPGRVLARPGAAPLRRLRRYLPLQGRLCERLPLKKAPLQGELAAP